MNTTWYISKRLLGIKGGKRNKTATIVSTVGVTLSILTVLLTLSIVKGFQKELKEKILAFSSPLAVYTYSEYYNDDSEKDLELIKGIAAELKPSSRVSRTIFIPSLLKSETNYVNLVLQNLNDSIKRDYFEKYIVKGSVNLDSIATGLVLSEKTATELGVAVGNRLDVVIPAGKTVKLRKLIVSGIFDTHFSDYDENIGFVPETFIKSIIKTDTKASNRISIDFPVNDLDSIPYLSSLFQSKLNDIVFYGDAEKSYTVDSILNEAGIYFGWLKLMDTNVSIIILLMVFISVFTLIGSLIIIILDKVPLIGILKTLGTPNWQIRRIFLIAGLRIVLLSIILADAIACFIIFIQKQWRILPLNPDEYYLSEVPMGFNVYDFMAVDIGILLIALAALMLPITIINRINPAKVIRFK